MANAYLSLDVLKGTGALNVTGTVFDTRLRQLSERVSREADRYANRAFFWSIGTLYFDGGSEKAEVPSRTNTTSYIVGGAMFLQVPDLVAVTSLKEDTNLDGTYETTWAATDYHLWPYNAQPTKEWGRPYTRLMVNTRSDGTQDVFLGGQKNYQVVGTWGWWQLSGTSGRNGTLTDGVVTSLVFDGTVGGTIEAGHTVLIDNELVYVTVGTASAGTSVTVERAVNNTTGTAHTNKAANLVQYPGPVCEAVFIQVARLWKRKDSGFATEIGMPETGQLQVFRGLDSDVKRLLDPYRKLPVGIGI